MEAPPPSFDPTPNRDHAWLFVNLKRTEHFDKLESVVFSWIAKVYGFRTADRCRDSVKALAGARQRAAAMSQISVTTIRGTSQDVHTSFDKDYFGAGVTYCLAMQNLLKKTAGTSSGFGLTELDFVWYHYLSGPPPSSSSSSSASYTDSSFPAEDEPDVTTTGSLRMDVLCVMFNLAAMCSILGAVLPARLRPQSTVMNVPRDHVGETNDSQKYPRMVTQESEECIKHRCARFRTSAKIFELTAQLSTKWNISCDEIDPVVCALLSTLMLAQAQECAYVDFKQHYNLPNSMIDAAQRAHSASLYYQRFIAGYEALEEGPSAAGASSSSRRCVHIPQSFLAHSMCVRASLRASLISHWIEARFENRDDYGVFVGNAERCIRIANSAVEDVLQCDPTAYMRYVADLRDLRERCRKRWLLLNNENLDVMKKPVPDMRDIEESIRLDGVDVVALAAICPSTVQSPPLRKLLMADGDEFQFITSIAASHAWGRYRAVLGKSLKQYATELASLHNSISGFIRENPHYLLLYFVAHRLGVNGSAQLEPHETPVGLAAQSVRGTRWTMFIKEHGDCEKNCSELKPILEGLEAAERALANADEAADTSDKLRDRARAIAELGNSVSVTAVNNFSGMMRQWDVVRERVTGMIARSNAEWPESMRRILTKYSAELYDVQPNVEAYAKDLRAKSMLPTVSEVSAVDERAASLLNQPGADAAQAPGLLARFIGTRHQAPAQPMPFSKLPDSSDFRHICAKLVAILDSAAKRQQEMFDELIVELRKTVSEFDSEVSSIEVSSYALDSWLADRNKWVLNSAQSLRDYRASIDAMRTELDGLDGLGSDGISAAIARIGYSPYKESSIKEFAEAASVVFVGPLVFSFTRATCVISGLVALKCIEDARACKGQCDDFSTTIQIARNRERKAREDREAVRRQEAASASGRYRGANQGHPYPPHRELSPALPPIPSSSSGVGAAHIPRPVSPPEAIDDAFSSSTMLQFDVQYASSRPTLPRLGQASKKQM